jgi:hypothetical protein
MKPDQLQALVPPGWVGGFEESDPAFAYPDPPNPNSPNPDLSSLKMLGNMDNIDKLQRQQPVEWPEFSWETQKGQPDPKRCFQMFAHYISRIGYTDTGRVYSIICPQQGVCHAKMGCMNVEVTVTGQRGWVNETTREMAADMTVMGQIWFSPLADESVVYQMIWNAFKKSGLPFPQDKANSIKVKTHLAGNRDQPIFPVRKGQTERFKSPSFAIHDDAWTVAHLEVEIGEIHKTKNALVDEFNQLVMDAFNLASGNMLQAGNLLTWNIWFKAPKLVDQEEWRTHAERWRKSIDEGHGAHAGSPARYFDGTPFSPVEELIEKKVMEIIAWIWKHL